MPAVRAFALYAAGALTINFIMQITCFVSMMSLDQKRFAKGYYDVLCCVKGQKSDESAELKPGFIQDFINNVFVPTLFKPWCRFITLGSLQSLVYFIFPHKIPQIQSSHFRFEESCVKFSKPSIASYPFF